MRYCILKNIMALRLILITISLSVFTPGKAMEQLTAGEAPSPLDPPFLVRISTQIKSTEVQNIYLENYDKMFVAYKIGEEAIQTLGRPTIEDIQNSINQRINIGEGEINISNKNEYISFFCNFWIRKGVINILPVVVPLMLNFQKFPLQIKKEH